MTGDGGGFIHRNPDSESNLQRANQRSAHIRTRSSNGRTPRRPDTLSKAKQKIPHASKSSRWVEGGARPSRNQGKSCPPHSHKAIPRNLLILILPRLDRQTAIVHLVHVARRLHVGEDVFLQLGDRLQRVGDRLTLLDVADDVCGLGAFGEVDEIGGFDGAGDSIFDEGEIGEVDA